MERLQNMSGRSFHANSSPPSAFSERDNYSSTPRDARTPKASVSFGNDLEDTRDAVDGISVVSRTAGEMHALRSIQTARAVVASERQKLLTRTQAIAEKPMADRSTLTSLEPEKRASEEQLFEEVGLLMQERDLLLREKSALQAILASSAEEIRRLFDAEQKHVMDMKSWLHQKESLEQERDLNAMQLEQLKKEAEVLRKSNDQLLIEKQVKEKERLALVRDQEDMQERFSAAQQELTVRRSAEQAHKGEREEWSRQQEIYSRQLAESHAEAKALTVQVEQLKLDANLHRKAAERWEQERSALQEDRTEMERLKLLVAQHMEESRRWTAIHEQLLKERADAHAQLQLGLQQIEQQQRNLELHNGEKAQWLKQQEASAQARSAVESRNKALEDEIAKLRQLNANFFKEREELSGRYSRAEQDLAESARHLSAARADFEKMKQQKNSLSEELDVIRRELEAKKQECNQLDLKLRDARNELARLSEVEALYAREREERVAIESRLGQRISELQETGKGLQTENHQLAELCDALKTEVQHFKLERQGLVDERTRLQHRLKLTLQELEHLRANEKRYEVESAEWLHTHSSLLERVLRHGRDLH